VRLILIYRWQGRADSLQYSILWLKHTHKKTPKKNPHTEIFYAPQHRYKAQVLVLQ